jgi:hypothetical protein
MDSNPTFPGPAPAAGPTSGPGAGPSAAALPPLPPGANPETYQIETVTDLLKKAAYLSIFSRADPSRPNTPIPAPGNPAAIIGVEVNEDLHRFDVHAQGPTAKEGFRVKNRFGEAVANVHIRWMVIPDTFEAGPGREPPPTPLNPMVSQRFTMLDGQMTFKDRGRSGFRAFGTGRTFPVLVGGRPQLRLGAVIDVLEEFGPLRGLPASGSVTRSTSTSCAPRERSASSPPAKGTPSWTCARSGRSTNGSWPRCRSSMSA